MKIIQLNGESLRSKEELHQFFQEQLELGEHYGGNLDALWDCLTGAVSMPLIMKWMNYEKSIELLGSYADQVVELLREAEEEIEGFSFELEK